MRNTVSAPVAALVLVIVAASAILYFTRLQPGEQAEPEVFVLPFAPSVEDQEIAGLRKALLPMGVTAVHPPLLADRFQGARLASISRSSPAQLAGLQAGDLVTKFDEKQIVQAYSLAAAVASAKPEESHTVIYQRSGEEHEATITGIQPPVRAGVGANR